MKSTRALPALPLVVSRGLAKLGGDLAAARKRRRLTMALLAERALISVSTLRRVERGDPAVSMGIYATVLFVLGLAEGLASLADLTEDAVGRSLDEERLPQRVRLPKAKARS